MVRLHHFTSPLQFLPICTQTRVENFPTHILSTNLCRLLVCRLPPPTDSVSPEGYLPRDLYDLDNSKYGNLSELRDTIAAFHENGVKVLADAVLNHRCAHFQDQDGTWNVYGTAYHPVIALGFHRMQTPGLRLVKFRSKLVQI